MFLISYFIFQFYYLVYVGMIANHYYNDFFRQMLLIDVYGYEGSKEIWSAILGQ